MRAVVADRPGSPEVLRTLSLPDPEPGPGQVRVVVEVSAISFIDTLIRSGSAIAPATDFPLIPGNGVGGVIDRVGPDVDEAWLDNSVITTTGGAGGYASHALARVSDLHRLPEALSLDVATALLADGRTAVGLQQAAVLQPGEEVVITAASGGVGSILVQLAKASGARVIALAGSATKLGHARSLGADATVNYRETGWVTRLRETAPEGVHVIFDGIGAETTTTLFPLVQRGGRYLLYGAAGGGWGTFSTAKASERGIAVIPLSAIGTSSDALFDLTERALALAVQGTIKPTIGQTFSLEEAAEAHAAISARATIGKTLLLP